MKLFGISAVGVGIIILLQVYFESPSTIRMRDAGQEFTAARPDSGEAYVKLGEEYLKENNSQSTENALAAFKKAIRLKPDYAEAYLGLGRAYHERHIYAPQGYDHPKEEVDAYLKAIELKPTLAESYVCLGDTFLPEGRQVNGEESHGKAVELYNKALQVDPRCAAAYAGLCGIYLSQKRFTEAEAASKQALLLNPDDRGMWRVLHDSCWMGERCQEVVPICEEVIQANPNNQVGVQVTARIYYKLGRLDDSISAYRRLTELAPEKAEAHYELGSAYIAAGDKQAALGEYNRLKSIESKAAFQRDEVYSYSAKKLLDKIDSGTVRLVD